MRSLLKGFTKDITRPELSFLDEVFIKGVYKRFNKTRLKFPG